jgi:RNA polymerase sigma factor (sigma-70 family)
LTTGYLPGYLVSREGNCMTSQTHRIVSSLARRYARPGLDADDLRQEGYLRLLTAPPRPDHVAIGTWTWLQARQRIRDVAAYRQHRRHDGLPDDLTVPDPPEWSDWLHSLLATLKPREAETVILVCGLDGGSPRSCDQVAHLTGLTVPGTYQRYYRAIAKLRITALEVS